MFSETTNCVFYFTFYIHSTFSTDSITTTTKHEINDITKVPPHMYAHRSIIYRKRSIPNSNQSFCFWSTLAIYTIRLFSTAIFFAISKFYFQNIGAFDWHFSYVGTIHICICMYVKFWYLIWKCARNGNILGLTTKSIRILRWCLFQLPSLRYVWRNLFYAEMLMGNLSW